MKIVIKVQSQNQKIWKHGWMHCEQWVTYYFTLFIYWAQQGKSKPKMNQGPKMAQKPFRCVRPNIPTWYAQHTM